MNLQRSNAKNAIMPLLVITSIIAGAVVVANAQSERPQIQINGLLKADVYDAVIGKAINFEIDTSVVPKLASANVIAVSWTFGDSQFFRSTGITEVEHAYTRPGIYRAKVDVITKEMNYTSALLIQVRERPRPHPLAQVAEVIQYYDVNRNNRISDSEFFLLIDSWVEGDIDDETFFIGVDVWTKDEVITSLTARGVAKLSVQAKMMGRHAMTFRAAGAQLSNLFVQVYDASGKPIFSDSAPGPSLSWNLNDSTGARVARGVYFYTLTAVDEQSRLLKSTPKALVVLP